MSTALRFSPVTSQYRELLRRHYHSQWREGHVRCEGTVMHCYYQEVAQNIIDMEVRDDDIWVCTFPKSGTTWAQEMVWCIANDLDFVKAKSSIRLRFPFLESATLLNYKELQEIPGLDFPPYQSDSVAYVNNMSSPRFIKTHLPFHLLPLQLQRGQTGAKVVWVTREVKDVCVSKYHEDIFEGYTLRFEDFLTLFIEDAMPYTPFWSHVLGYWKKRNSIKMLHLQFEGLKKDLPTAIRRTAAFLGKELSDRQVGELSDHLSFESMKRNPAVNHEDKEKFLKQMVNSEGSAMPSGQVGQWRNKFSPEWIQRYNSWSDNNIGDSGFSFEYHEA